MNTLKIYIKKPDTLMNWNDNARFNTQESPTLVQFLKKYKIFTTKKLECENWASQIKYYIWIKGGSSFDIGFSDESGFDIGFSDENYLKRQEDGFFLRDCLTIQIYNISYEIFKTLFMERLIILEIAKLHKHYDISKQEVINTIHEFFPSTKNINDYNELVLCYNELENQVLIEINKKFNLEDN